MKQRIIKYILMAIGLAFTGEAYLIIKELQQLRNTAQAAVSMASQVNGALKATNRTLTTVVKTQRKLVKTGLETRNRCNIAGGEAKKVINEVEGLRKDVKKVLKRLGG